LSTLTKVKGTTINSHNFTIMSNSVLSNYDTVVTEDVFTSGEYIPDDEGTLFYGESVVFGEYHEAEDEDDMYEPDVFEYDD